MVDDKQEVEAETKLFRYIETTLKTVKINQAVVKLPKVIIVDSGSS